MAKKRYTEAEKETILRRGKTLHRRIETDNGGNWLSEVSYTYTRVVMYEGKFYWIVDKHSGGREQILEFEEIK